MEPVHRELAERAKPLNILRYQGYVVRDNRQTRIKVKSPHYTLLSELDKDYQFASKKKKEKVYLLLVRYY